MEPRPNRPPALNHATSGFALAAIVLLTVAVVVPEVDAVASQDTRGIAVADVNAIGVALRMATSDVGGVLRDPTGATPGWFFGPGIRPRGNAFAHGRGFPLSGILVSDRIKAGEKWRGPYLSHVPIDPWGRAYVVNNDPASHSRSLRFIVSAGPDGVMDTAPGSGTVAGDDVGIVLMP